MKRTTLQLPQRPHTLVLTLLLAITSMLNLAPQAVNSPRLIAVHLPSTNIPEKSCLSAQQAYYYAYTHEKEQPHNFGPSADIGNSESVIAESKRRLCGDALTGGDPRLAMALHSVIEWYDPNTVVTSRTMWEKLVNDIVANIISAHVEVWIPPPGSLTMYMSEGRGMVNPYIGFDNAQQVPDKYLIMTIARHKPGDGFVTLRLRLGCGFQPTGLDVTALQQEFAKNLQA